MTRSSIARVADPLPGGQLRRLNPDDLGDHLDRLFRAAWGLCGDRQEAEDLVQDTYAQVLAQPRWLRGDDDLGYLLRALRNTQVSRARARARRPQTTELGERAELRTRWDPERLRRGRRAVRRDRRAAAATSARRSSRSI